MRSDTKHMEGILEVYGYVSESQKVLGHTRSGKKVYNIFKPELYSDFSKQDHLDAAQILGKESYKLSQFQMKDKDALASEYNKYAMMHTNQYKK